MTLLADYLRDNTGKTFRIAPNFDGELVISADIWDEEWTAPTYVTGTRYAEFQTLADSAGTNWYVYVRTDEGYPEIVISPTALSMSSGVWDEAKYGTKLTPTEATVGDEIYLAMKDTLGTDYYVYPNAEGELIIATTEPI